jgi:molecular chaperone GrpE
MQQPGGDVPPGGVVQVLSQGYVLHDRVLRPATVIVAADAS